MFGLGKRSAPEPVSNTQGEKPPSPKRRGRLTGQRMFDSANTDRLTSKWSTTPLSADTVITRNQTALVARSREQTANNDYAKAFPRMCRQNIVGSGGVMLQAQSKGDDRKLDKPANQAIEDAWKVWCRKSNVDVAGKKPWRRICLSVVTSACVDGEFFIQIIRGKEAGPYGFSLKVIDAQRCPVDFNQDSKSGGTFIRHGIQFNRHGRPLAYFFTTTNAAEADYHFNGRQFVKIPAEQIIHNFVDEMTGQKRGLPWMATGLWRLKMLEGFEKSALVNARLSASKQGFFEWAEGMGPEAEEDEEIFIDGSPGAIHELPAGVSFKEWSVQYPGGEFAVSLKAMLRGAAAGFGVLYNNLAGDLEGVNFSSIRQGTLSEREFWKELQEWLIESFIEPVYENWLSYALLSQKIKVGNAPLKPVRLEKYLNVRWLPRRWTWIDPNADVKAAEKSKDNLLMSPGQIIRDWGRDPKEVWTEFGDDIKEMIAAGIPENLVLATISEKLGDQIDVPEV